MELKLDTWERVMLYEVIGGIRGNVATIVKAMEILKPLGMTKGEKELVGLREESGRLDWDDAAYVWTVKIPDDGVDLLKMAASSYEGWRTVDLPKVVELMKKLGVGSNGTD